MSLPLVRLPSLDLVKGFVAVGRRMSITLAAEDLCLTQSAVSRQVSALEEALGVKLLVRGHRSIRFTADGEKFFKVADMAVQQLQDAMAAMHQRHEKQPVTITASIGVVGLWLLPRLGALNEELPDVDVRIATSNKLMDLRAEGVDIAIRYCAPSAAPEGAVPLFGETLVPVAHPSLRLRGRPAAEVVKQYVLLEFDEPKQPWLQWNEKLKLMGLERLKPRGIIRFNQYDQLIHAATSGRGVALGRSALVAPLVKAGSLEALGWDQGQWTSSHQYWLVQSDLSPTPDVQRVCQWIRRQAASDTH
ncbi:LysR substrate-binding domain-containing protein [Sorangium sp. So ce1389]|uniref:LysR substrate-binding domain-containing protein n=1 Tax=Sorangium sp. So ce1389 TaxID=3133336 RepID=UPI003F64584C